jgi:hypothetical protein
MLDLNVMFVPAVAFAVLDTKSEKYTEDLYINAPKSCTNWVELIIV